MRLIFAISITVLIFGSATTQTQAAPAEVVPSVTKSALIRNELVARKVSWNDGHLATETIFNRIGQTQVEVDGGHEFELTIRLAGTTTDLKLNSADFEVKESTSDPANSLLNVQLSSKSAPLEITVRYHVKPREPWMRKQILVTARQPIQIKRVQVEHLATADTYAPYRANQLTAQGRAKWRPPLGQPLYTKTSGIWWGVEFPAARNHVQEGKLICGYLTAVDLKSGDTWASHAAVVGVSDAPDFVKDAFLDYIDTVRARPLRLQTQYNSWFDYHKAVDTEKFTASVRKVNDELVVKRDVPPLRAYVIDDGWQDTAKDWSKVGVWPVNQKFAPDFKQAREEVEKAKSSLGLWLSPGCLFGGQPAIPKMRAAGWRSLDPWMSMTDPDYMSALELRMVELAASGVDYFKLDGVFGHVNTRNFDIEGFKGSEQELNNAQYDEAKERYLSVGSERLMKLFQRMGQANPDIYIVISNGSFLSPWWLQYVDAIWMINAGDAASGANRSAELIYRDAIYFQLVSPTVDNTQFPLNSIFNHEPKKTEPSEDPEAFRRYLFMSLSRGTGIVELYLKTSELSAEDWDVLGDGLKWTNHIFPAFKRSRMIGGDPKLGDVYGYTGWTEELGYLSLHNPSREPREFKIVLDRALGLPTAVASDGRSYAVSTPLLADADSLPNSATAGQPCTVTLPPHAVRILEFKSINSGMKK